MTRRPCSLPYGLHPSVAIYGMKVLSEQPPSFAVVERIMTTLKYKIGTVVLPLLPINRRTFDILRHELRALCTRSLNAVNPGYWTKVRQLNRSRNISLNVGSGGRGLPGWVNVELTRMPDTTLCLDIRQPLPFADASVARMLAEHVVEHLDYRSDIPRVFGDWHRILQPGGVLRIVVPDAKRFVEAYATGDSTLWQGLGWDLRKMPEDIHTPMHVLNHIFQQSGEHLFAYDFETISLKLTNAGFTTIEQTSFRRSRDPQLEFDQANHAAYSLYIEAVKE